MEIVEWAEAINDRLEGVRAAHKYGTMSENKFTILNTKCEEFREWMIQTSTSVMKTKIIGKNW